MSDQHLNPLLVLEKKRQLLQEVLMIARSIEHLQSILNTMLVLSKPLSKQLLPLRETYAYFENAYQSVPSAIIAEDILRLDQYIHNNLQQILAIAKHPNAQPHTELAATPFAHTLMTLQDLICGFKKTVVTTLELRTLLHQRGTLCSPLSLGVSKQTLYAQIALLESKEKTYRGKLIQTIREMDGVISALLASPQLPAKMKALLSQQQAALLEDINHLQAGKPFANLPLQIETLELGVQVEELDVEIIELSPPVKPPRYTLLSQHIKEWLNTSWDIRWRDIRKNTSF